MRNTLLLLILLVSVHQTVFAACEADRFGVIHCGRGDCALNKAGNVFCSKYQFGEARLDEHGEVVCGKGQCATARKFKDIYCSTIEGGGAKRDRSGEVKCYGGCEKASAQMCESQEGR